MKKLITIIIVLILSFIQSVTAIASAIGFGAEEMQSIHQGQSLNLWQIRMVNDTFYALAEDRNIYTWQPDNGEVRLYCELPKPPAEQMLYEYADLPPSAKAIADSVVTHIVSGDGKLWGLNLYNGGVCKLSPEGPRWSSHFLDISAPAAQSTYFGQYNAASFVRDHVLYLIEDNQVIKMDLESGRQETLDMDYWVAAMVPYRDDYALLTVYETTEDTSWENALVLFNLSDGRSSYFDQALPAVEAADGAEKTSIKGLSYDMETDTLSFQAVNSVGSKENGMLYQSKGGNAFEAVAYLSMAKQEGYTLSDGRYAIPSLLSNEVIVYDLSEMDREEAVILNIKGMFHDTALAQRFSNDNPLITARSQFVNLNDADITAMITGDSNVDIYALYANRLYRSAADKGYASDLSASDSLVRWADSLYPAFRESLIDERGDLIAYPVGGGMSIALYTIDKKVWQACFGERAYPTTYPELFDIMVEWEDQHADEYDAYNAVGPFDLYAVPWGMVYQYVADYEQKDQPIDFDTPVFRQSVRALKEALSHIDQDKFRRNSLSGGLSLIDTGSLFVAGNSLIMGPEDEDLAVIPPFSFEEGAWAHVRAEMIVLMVNQRSMHKEEAIRFIEYLAERERIDDVVYYVMHQDENAPVEKPDYLRKASALSEQIEALERSLEVVKGSDRKGYEAKLQTLRYDLDRLQDDRWLITEEGVDRYTQVAERILPPGLSIYISQNDPENSLNTTVISLCKQLVNDSLTEEQFIQSLNNITRLIYFENR